MTIASYSTVLTQNASTDFSDPFYLQFQANTTSTVYTGQAQTRPYFFTTLKALPSLPGGISYWMPTSLEVSSTIARAITFAKLTLMGTLDISGPTFTDGSAVPTYTEGGTSRQVPSSILMVVSTAFNATPGNFTVTYVDQDNNGAETTSSGTLTGSCLRGTAGILTLNAGDWGAIDITTATRTAGTTPTGVIKFYHVWPIAPVSVPIATQAQKYNFLTDFPNLIKLGAGDAIGVFSTTTSAGALVGSITYQGMA